MALSQNKKSIKKNTQVGKVQESALHPLELFRPGFPDLEMETWVGYPRLQIAGVDEVGRGCLAGPVVAAALILPPVVNFKADPWLLEIRDSKLLKAEVRERLAPKIKAWALGVEVGVATASEIDEINIFQASHLAMCRALHALKVKAHHVLVDGKWLPKNLGVPATAIIKGDLKCLSIAAASVVAKVWRDARMAELDLRWPEYGFAKHKGYPTAQHHRALAKCGVIPEHRRSFNLRNVVVDQ